MCAVMVDGANKTFTAGAAIAQWLRVKLSTGKLAAADAVDIGIGYLEEEAFADLENRSVRLYNAAGTVKVVAKDSFSVGAQLYSAAGGKVTDAYTAGAYWLGTALEAATAENDIVEMLQRDPAMPMVAGTDTASGAEATANTMSIATGLSSIVAFGILILRSGVVVGGDAALSASAGNLVVADGSTFNLTTGDVVHWWAVGGY